MARQVIDLTGKQLAVGAPIVRKKGEPIRLQPQLPVGTIRLVEPRFIKKGIITGLTPQEKFERFEKTTLAKTITSPRLTAALGGILGGLTGGFIGAAKGFAFGGLAGGAIAVSPKVRTFLKEKVLRPEKAGEFIGGIIEDPSQLQPTTEKPFKEQIIAGAKGAGLLGLLAALGIGTAAGVKKLKEAKIPKVGIPSIPSVVIPKTPIAPAAVPLQPIGAAEKEPKKEKEVTPMVPMEIINKIINRPEINIRVSAIGQKKRFINQQNIIRMRS